MPHLTIGDLQIHYTVTGQGDETLLIFPDNLHCAQAYEDEIAHFAGRYQLEFRAASCHKRL